ncbi:MAG: hypothetical protein Fur0046_00130 [Cyanobacteria bacterium J069]|nr:MAG: TVP38/TMEM64 family protein [Cyanobacteria bacterium J069]
MRLRRRLRALLTRQTAIALTLLLVSSGAVWYLQRQSQVDFLDPHALQQAIQQWGWLGPVVYIALLTLAIVMFQIPNLPLAIAAGAIWGPFAAGCYSVIGGTLGALIAYFLGLTLGQSLFKATLGKIPFFSKRRSDRPMGWAIFVSRLLPIYPFDLISYGAGMSHVPLRIYLIATVLGMIPPTFLLTYLGDSLMTL